MAGRLLIPFSGLSSFRLLHTIAGSFSARGWAVAMLYCGGDDGVQAAARTSLAGSDVALHGLSDYSGGEAQPASPPLRRGMPHPWRSRLLGLGARFRRFYSLRLFRDLHSRDLTTAAACLNRLRPDSVIVAEDGISAPLALMAAIRDASIPTLDVPYGFGLRIDLDIDLQHKQDEGTLFRPTGRSALGMRMIAPQWVKRGRFAGALMYRPAFILGAEAVGISVRDAWTIHGGFADRLCAESAVNRRHYLDEGIPADKIVLTGSPYCDMVVRAAAADPAAQRAFRQARRIAPDRLRLLVSWPPSYHGTRSCHCDFARYEDMTLTVLGALGRIPGLDLTVSLHPAVDPAIRHTLAAHGIAVTDAYVIDLIPRHDLFLTYFSSTIRWAIAAGKPVINYDCYRLAMDIYDEAKGVVRIETADALTARVRELAETPGAYEALTERQILSADDWGLMDGHCTDRIAAELDRLIAATTRSKVRKTQ